MAEVAAAAPLEAGAMLSAKALPLLEVLTLVELLAVAGDLRIPALAALARETEVGSALAGLGYELAVSADGAVHIAPVAGGSPLDEAGLSALAGTVGDALEAAVGGGAVSFLGLADKVTRACVRVLRDALAAESLVPDAALTALEEVRVIHTSCDSGEVWMVPFEVNWMAHAGQGVFTTPDAASMAKSAPHREYLLKHNGYSSWGQVLSYFLYDCFFVPAHELVHIAQHHAKQTDLGGSISWSAEHDASRGAFLVQLLALKILLGAGELPSHFPLLLLCHALRRFLQMRRYMQSTPPPPEDGEGGDAPEAASGGGGVSSSGEGSGAGAVPDPPAPRPVPLSVYHSWAAAWGMNAPDAAWEAAGGTPFAEDCIKHMCSIDAAAAALPDSLAVVRAVAAAGRAEGAPDSPIGRAEPAETEAQMVRLAAASSALLRVMFRGRTGRLHDPEALEALHAAIAAEGVPHITETSAAPWLGL